MALASPAPGTPLQRQAGTRRESGDYASVVPYRLTLFDDQDGRPVHAETFDTPEHAGRAAMTSQRDRMEQGGELWPSVVYVDVDGKAHALEQEKKEAFQAGMDMGMNELMD